MIVEFILNMLKNLFLSIVSLLPDTSFTANLSGFSSWFGDILSTVSYFLPVGDFFIMFGIFFIVTNFQIVWKTTQRIWDALPFT